MVSFGFVLIALAIFLYSLVSQRTENWPVTPPMIFAALGLLFGTAGLGLAPMHVESEAIHLVAEIALALVLFTDAARIRLPLLFRDHNVPFRLLALGMPLTIVFGAVGASKVFPGLSMWEAALLAAILAPTDAALGQAVVMSSHVPQRIRQALNVESGLNDGIALPVVLVFLCFALVQAGFSHESDLVFFTVSQLVMGPLAGLAIGGLGSKLVEWAGARGYIGKSFQGVAAISLAFLAFAGAELVGGNGFIAAFVAGLALGHFARRLSDFLLEFVEAEGEILVLIVFFLFGASLLPEALGAFDWRVLAFAVFALTAMRMAPVSLSLMGTGLGWRSHLFLGWFGPRGLASVLFVLLVLNAEGRLPGADIILAVTMVTVGLSILAHGLTAAPLARLYGQHCDARLGRPEHREVTELRWRKASRRAE